MFSEDLRKFIIENFRTDFYKNKSVLYKLLTLINQDLGIDNYILNIFIKRTIFSSMGLYFPDIRAICVDPSYIRKRVTKLIQIGELKSDDINLYINFYVLLCILHEAIHAKQLHILLEDSSKYKSILELTESIKEGRINLKGSDYLNTTDLADIYYNKYHDLYPVERQAIIESISFVCSLKEEIDPSYLNIFMNAYIDGFLNSISPYIKDGELTCPASLFFNSTLGVDIVNDLDLYGFSNRDKFIFGLPLSLEDLSCEASRVFAVKDDTLVKKYLRLGD